MILQLTATAAEAGLCREWVINPFALMPRVSVVISILVPVRGPVIPWDLLARVANQVATNVLASLRQLLPCGVRQRVVPLWVLGGAAPEARVWDRASVPAEIRSATMPSLIDKTTNDSERS